MADPTTPLDVEKLAASLTERLSRIVSSRRQSDDGDDYGDHERGRVPYSRFATKVNQVKDLTAQIERLQGEVAQLSQGYEAKLAEMQAATQQQIEAIGKGHAEDLRLVEMGLGDDLGRAALRQAWEAAPKDARGKSPADWWSSTLEAHKAHAADPEKATAPEVPKVLAAYLPQQAAPAPAPAQQRGAFPGTPTPRQATAIGDIKADIGIAGLAAALRAQEG